MSFIIQGINMPTDGTNITLTIKSDGTYESIYDTEICGDVIQIPKEHGRLADIDVIYRAFSTYAENETDEGKMEVYAQLVGLLLHAPTILEMEG